MKEFNMQTDQVFLQILVMGLAVVAMPVVALWIAGWVNRAGD